MNIEEVRSTCGRIHISALGIPFEVRVEHDNENPDGRVFVQVQYTSPCSRTNEARKWSGRKWYLSRHMTEDEIVKTVWSAFEATIRHEAMEGFTIDRTILFNPHVSFESLLEVSGREVRRVPQ